MRGLALNEDNSHYFFSRGGQRLDAEAVASWVDQYAGTQVTTLLLNPNAMCVNYASTVWDPIWHGYDPDAADDQPLFASLPPDGRDSVRKWVHLAWRLDQDHLDPYAIWIARSRQHGISPWISMRMNDVHCVDDECNFMHSELWRTRPDLWRVPERFGSWTDRAFDYGQPEVRAHHLRLIHELAERYDFDGLELDWMRFGYHFRPGYEREGAALLTEFTAGVRRLLDECEERRGHKIQLSARVPSRPYTALNLGMDAVAWARRGLIDQLVVTPFWASIEPDMPIELWLALLEGTGVTLAAGLELLLRPYPGYRERLTNSLETVRGTAAALLERGADGIYLFNYMDCTTAIDDLYNYPTLLREVGSLATIAGKYRRHVLTYADTWAPGEPPISALPVACAPGGVYAFRLPTGPRPARESATLVLGVVEGTPASATTMEARVNGARCTATGPIALPMPRPEFPVYGFSVPPDMLLAGDNLIEVTTAERLTLGWVEVSMDHERV